MKKIITAIFVITLSLVLYSCITTQTSVIITGTTRPAISPSEVKIYVDPPAKFETIAIIDATREIGTTRQAAKDVVISELRSQAAKMGGNGLILVGTGSQSSGGVVVSNVVIPVNAVTVQVRIIYVIQE